MDDNTSINFRKILKVFGAVLALAERNIGLAMGISFLLHVLVFAFFVWMPSFDIPEPEATKITWLRLSYGDGGTNQKANLKKLDKLPDSTIREQREALKHLKKLRKLKVTKNAKKLEVPNYKKDKVKADKKVIKIGKKKEKKKKTVVKKYRTRTDKAVADVLERLKKRDDKILQIRKAEIGVAQSKDKNTGQSLQGTTNSNVRDPALITYYNLIKRKINRQWILAKKDYSTQLKAKIVVKIDAQGGVMRTWFKSQSNDGSFNASALRAVRKASPFPRPPMSIRKEVLTEGFEFIFSPRSVTGKVSFN